MAFFTRQDIGRIYVVKLVLPDNTVVHKVGMCNSDRSADRMMEILRSWFMQFRFVPYTELKLDIQCHNAIQVEKYIHKILKPLAFIPNFKVQGSTEMFADVDEYRLLWFIRSLINSNYAAPPGITGEQSESICKLLVVNYEY